MVATRLLTVLGTNNAKEQFATVRCQEALHCLRSTLILGRLHKKETFILFFDLFKAFDTVNHDLVFKVLLKFGIPEELVGVVREIYAECKVKVKVRKEERDIDYITGVQEGESVAPILFLFFLLAVSSILRKIWPYKALEFGHFPSRLWLKSGRL
jgi:hypothetical protein